MSTTETGSRPARGKTRTGAKRKPAAPVVPQQPMFRREAPLSVVYWPLDRLKTYERNARTHSKAQIAEIAASITSFGFSNPLLIDEAGTIIAGHGRLQAARALGLADVPVIVLSGLSEAQRRALTLADNRIALNAGWDLDMLRLELRDLADLGCDLKTLGFTRAEMAAALNGDVATGLTDEDTVPDGECEAVSRSGDLWLLPGEAGEHRIICGDCTNPETVERLLGNHRPRLMVTDPPYGVEYDPQWRHRLGVNTSKRTGKVLNDERADWAEAWALFPGEITYVWHGALHAATVADSLIRTGFTIRAQIVWAKTRLVIGRGDYHWQHEPCWYGVRKTGHWTGDRKQTTLWTIAGPGGARATDDETERETDENAATVHGTQKPVECMRRPMLNNSEKGDCIYEPFLGSGTTLIAAETIGRLCLSIELNPAYIDIAIRRWQAFTGKQAVLLSNDGAQLSFDEIARLRASEIASISEPVDNAAQNRNAANAIEADRILTDTRETQQRQD